MASSIPAYLSVLIAAGCTTFTPIYAGVFHEKAGWRQANNFLNITGIVTLGLSVFGALFSKQIVGLLAPGFDDGQLRMASGFFSIVVFVTFFNTWYDLLSAILYMDSKYLLPVVSQIAGVATGAALFIPITNTAGSYSMPITFLISAGIPTLILLAAVLIKRDFQLKVKFSDPLLRNCLSSSFPAFLTGILVRSTTIIERGFASAFPQGAISYLGYANQLVQMLCMISTVGIVTLLYPAISKLFTKGDLAAVRQQFRHGIRAILLITLPVSAIILVFSEPIVRIVFERGAFDRATTKGVSETLLILLGSLFAIGLGNLLGKIYPLTRKTLLGGILDLAAVFLYIGLCFLFRNGGYRGLAAASSISNFVSILVTVVAMRAVIGISLRKLGSDNLPIFLSAVLMLCFMLACSYYFGSGFIALSLGITIGCAAYVVSLLFLFHFEEAIMAKNELQRYATVLRSRVGLSFKRQQVPDRV